MAHDRWSRVPSAAAYWQMLREPTQVIHFNPLVVKSLDEEVKITVPMIHWTDPVFPAGPFAYHATTWCGPYMLFHGNVEEDTAITGSRVWQDEEPLNEWTDFPAGREVSGIGEQPGFGRIIRPLWNVIPVTGHEPLAALVEGEYGEMIEYLFTTTDADEDLDNWLHKMAQDWISIPLVRTTIEQQRQQWISMLLEVGDVCSSSQLPLLGRHHLVFS